MAVTVFIVGGKPSGIKSFVSDAVISFEERFSNKITSHPVDSKANITDHASNDNPVFTVTGSVSNYPVWEYPDNEVGYVGDRVEEAHNLLKEIWRDRLYITIVSEHSRPYNTCLMKDYSVKFDVESSDVLNYSCTFEQVRFASSQQIVGTETSSEAVGDNKQGTKDLGNTSPTEDNPSRAIPYLNNMGQTVPAAAQKVVESINEIAGEN